MDLEMIEKKCQAHAEALSTNYFMPHPTTPSVAPLQHTFPTLVACPVYAASATVAPLVYVAPAEQTVTMPAAPQQRVFTPNMWNRH